MKAKINDTGSFILKTDPRRKGCLGRRLRAETMGEFPSPGRVHERTEKQGCRDGR
jgi:hypothetical protein